MAVHAVGHPGPVGLSAPSAMGADGKLDVHDKYVVILRIGDFEYLVAVPATDLELHLNMSNGSSPWFTCPPSNLDMGS